jgi:hypothetical protein
LCNSQKIFFHLKKNQSLPLSLLRARVGNRVSGLEAFMLYGKYSNFKMNTVHKQNRNFERRTIYFSIHKTGRSQWPRGLSHELSSLARTLRSWVRIPLKAWMSVSCAFTLSLCYSVCRWRPCKGLIPRPRSPTDCIWDQETEKSAKAHQRAV